MSWENPLLGMAVYSLTNALELYQKNEPTSEERRRFGAIILMDLSVEYILKAKIYQIDPSDFIKKTADLGFPDVMNDKRITFVGDEPAYLWKVHNARNYSQHRGSITDSLFSQEYIKWLCKFFDRFTRDNFGYKVIE